MRYLWIKWSNMTLHELLIFLTYALFWIVSPSFILARDIHKWSRDQTCCDNSICSEIQGVQKHFLQTCSLFPEYDFLLFEQGALDSLVQNCLHFLRWHPNYLHLLLEASISLKNPWNCFCHSTFFEHVIQHNCRSIFLFIASLKHVDLQPVNKLNAFICKSGSKTVNSNVLAVSATCLQSGNKRQNKIMQVITQSRD